MTTYDEMYFKYFDYDNVSELMANRPDIQKHYKIALDAKPETILYFFLKENYRDELKSVLDKKKS